MQDVLPVLLLHALQLHDVLVVLTIMKNAMLNQFVMLPAYPSDNISMSSSSVVHPQARLPKLPVHLRAQPVSLAAVLFLHCSFDLVSL